WLETQSVTLLAALAVQITRYARRPVFSGFGRFSCEQAYYYCCRCGQEQAPSDEQLQISHRQMSPGRNASLSGHLSFLA
ncbi:MAG: hypothetical protein NZ823_10395, partial [Blastocatellia bacterium]|nr:hypothetical protein [Blastocatellia bacterium]